MKMKYPQQTAVVILGAGASKPLGFPVQDELWDFLKKKFQLSPEKTLERLWKYQTNNVEKLFTQLELSGVDQTKRLQESTTYCESNQLIIDLKNLIAQAFLAHKTKGVGEELCASLLPAILSNIPEVTFVSLNWDTGLEEIMRGKNIAMNYNLTLDDMPQFVPTSHQHGIPFLKLHGSVDWKLCHYCKKFFRWGHPLSESFEVKGVITYLDKKQQDRLLKTMLEKQRLSPPRKRGMQMEFGVRMNCPFCRHASIETILIAPSLRKVCRLEYQDTITRRAYQSLETADVIIIIGYSFREADYDLYYILRECLDRAKLRRYFLFNSPEVTRKTAELLRFSQRPGSPNITHHMGFLDHQSVGCLAKILRS
jgi:hypothetical protein